MKKHHIATVVGLSALTLFIVLGTGGQVQAQERGQGGPESLIQKLVERFGLNQDDVQAFFDEIRQEKQTEMQAKREEKLNEAVANRDITEEQKNLITAKQEEMRTEMESLRDQDLTQEQRKELREQHRTEMQTWAEENGINLESLRPEGGRGMRGGEGAGFSGRQPQQQERVN